MHGDYKIHIGFCGNITNPYTFRSHKVDLVEAKKRHEELLKDKIIYNLNSFKIVLNQINDDVDVIPNTVAAFIEEDTTFCGSTIRTVVEFFIGSKYYVCVLF